MKPIRCLLLLATFLIGIFSSPVLRAADSGNLVKTLNLVVHRLIVDPDRGLIYSTTDGNNVVVIDPATLTVSKTLPVGTTPMGMSISPGGNRLYVALSGVKKIAVINLTTLSVLPALTISEKPYDVEAGLGNRLYVTPADQGGDLLQLDATTGATQATLDSFPPDKGLLAIKPDHTTLYFGDTGSSPSTLQRYDVSSPIPTLLQTADFGSTGENGRDLKISHNGLILCYPNGTGNGTNFDYGTDEIDPDDLNVRYGSFDVGLFPGPITFSPDDAVAFETSGLPIYLDAFDTATFVKVSSLALPYNDVSDMVTTKSGRYLFVAGDTSLGIYDLWADVVASATAKIGTAFSYQAPIFITPTSITASSLPAGLTFDEETRTISGTPTTDGTFPIVITASDGTHTVTVTLTLTIYLDSRALNISTRAFVQTGDNVLIGGFIIQGDIDKEVVVRAIGPSLAVNGIPLAGALADPTLELRDSTGALIASNDNWTTDNQSYVLINLNIAPTDFHEAALYRVLSPGEYTVIIRGANDTTGIALAEAYDINSGQEDNPRLGNISTRGRVETADNVMIGGFIIGGPADAPMLIRGLGPSLAAKDISDPLVDPRLDLYNEQGTKIASNDNWQDTQKDEIEATGLAPTDPREAAISDLLAPGAYTAVLSGVDGTTGVALVEAYNLP